ncbi:MAG: CPBP family intramembrane metalloprotease [Planctomycetes bacterium]|nr:CPBP family intramembrane metalloprotease [Planctomycetota bacterium]
MDRAASRRIALLDAGVVAGASLAYVAAEALRVEKRWTFLGAALLLGAYGLHLARRRSPSWREAGFRADNLRAGLLPCAAFTAAAAGGLAAWGRASGAPLRTSDVLLLLALYPAWALLQQFAFQGLLHRALMVLLPSPAPRVLAVATAFAAVHAGDPVLVLLTFAAGIAWSLLYRRWPNLWLLAASHAVLAALAYPLVLGGAPLSRL